MYKDDLDELIEKLKSDINNLEPGSQERSRAINDLKNLIETREIRKKNAEARMDKEHEDYESFKKDEANKKLEAERQQQEKKDRIWKRVGRGIEIGVTVVTGVLASAFTWYGLKMEYENGNSTSFTLKNCLRDLTHRK